MLFSAPTSGATCIFSTGYNATVTTNSSGQAVAPTCTGSGVAGTFNVNATVTGFPFVQFTLTLASVPYALTVVSGNNQQSEQLTTFSLPIVVLLTNAVGAGLSNITIQFTAPAGNASCTFDSTGNQTATAVTNVQGQANVTCTANQVIGSFSITAVVTTYTSVSTSVTETVIPQPVSAIIPLSGGGQQVLDGGVFQPVVLFVENPLGGLGKRIECNGQN